MAEHVGYPRDGVSRTIRLVGTVAIGAWLFWQIGMAGLAGLAVNSGDTRLLAFTGTPSHPKAGSTLAEAMLGAGDASAAADLARSITLVDPTNDQALRVLGLAFDRLGNHAAAAAVMGQAAGLGWRDTPTQLRVLRDAIVRNDAVTVIERADALARRNRTPNLARTIFLAAVNDPRLRAALADSLGAQPTWRTSFFSDVHNHLPASSIDGMAALFGAMRARGIPIAPGEWLNYIDRLIDLGEYRRARAIWATVFAIPAVRLVGAPYDGDFAQAAVHPATAPTSQFEWLLNPDLAGTVTFAGGTHGTSLALPADLSGGATIVSQLMILTPGTHLLSARVEGNAGSAAAGWTMTCLPSGQDMPRHLPHGPDDELSGVAFDVPQEDCKAQRLALVTRDRLEAQAVSIDDVRIR